ncbi:MAG: hypothetical protein OXE95_02995 [Chloroflexi bacterium]|nr:hypothetical protein [Chloroflexota bacterium]MCY4246530.1 hypothetical protein [Chloroflexota bacterium]
MLREAYRLDAAWSRDDALEQIGKPSPDALTDYAQAVAQQRAIKQRCELAHGRMYYWLPRAGLPAD